MYKEYLQHLSGSYFQISCTKTKNDLKDIINKNEKKKFKTRVLEKGERYKYRVQYLNNEILKFNEHINILKHI